MSVSVVLPTNKQGSGGRSSQCAGNSTEQRIHQELIRLGYPVTNVHSMRSGIRTVLLHRGSVRTRIRSHSDHRPQNIACFLSPSHSYPPSACPRPVILRISFATTLSLLVLLEPYSSNTLRAGLLNIRRHGSCL